MTTELEEQFFKVFGIESKWQYKVQQFCHFYYCDKKAILENAYLFKERKTCKVKGVKKAYPEITDRRLLEMICIFSQHCNFGRWNKYAMHSIDDFKYIMLSQLIEYQNKRYTYGIKEKIQQLFKENQ